MLIPGKIFRSSYLAPSRIGLVDGTYPLGSRFQLKEVSRICFPALLFSLAAAGFLYFLGFMVCRFVVWE